MPPTAGDADPRRPARLPREILNAYEGSRGARAPRSMCFHASQKTVHARAQSASLAAARACLGPRCSQQGSPPRPFAEAEGPRGAPQRSTSDGARVLAARDENKIISGPVVHRRSWEKQGGISTELGFHNPNTRSMQARAPRPPAGCRDPPRRHGA